MYANIAGISVVLSTPRKVLIYIATKEIQKNNHIHNVKVPVPKLKTQLQTEHYVGLNDKHMTGIILNPFIDLYHIHNVDNIKCNYCLHDIYINCYIRN